MDRAVPSDAYRYHTVRNDPEFPAGIFRQSSVIHSAVVFQAAVGDLRALSGTAQQPSEIRSGSSVYCLAGHRDQHHHHCWNLCGSIRIHHQLLHRLSSGRSGKGDSDPHTGWKPQGYLFKVVLPGSIPTLLSTTKVNIGLSLVGVIIGEFLAARRGLGYLIIYGSQVFQLDMVISSILLLCVIAMLLYLLTQSLEHYSKSTATDLSEIRRRFVLRSPT